MATKKKGGLDALFSKVFDNENVKDAIASLHTDYALPPEPQPQPVKAAVDHIVSVDTGGALPVPSNQPDKQSSKQTSKQPNNQTIRQANKQADNITNKQASSRTVEQATGQSMQQVSDHSDKQPDDQSSSQSAEQSTRQTIEQSNEHLAEQAVKQTTPQFSSKQKWLPLNENQGRILLFLYEKGGGLTNMEIVVAETCIAYGTARACIEVLIREGYVTYKARHNGHSFRGFEYAMNNHLCSLYAARVRGEQTEQPTGQSSRQSSNQANSQAMRQPAGQANSQAVTVVSSYLTDLKPTTTNNQETDSLLRDPELGYWRDKGVNSRQLNSWSDEFQMPIDQVIQSLKYCRYDMVVLNLEEEKQITNPMNWFYKVMQRSGLYPKPANYKSLAEIRAEQMEQAAKEAAGARERQRAAEQELAFQRILSDPDSAEYQKLFAQISDFARDMGGKALETALREAFDQQPKGATP